MPLVERNSETLSSLQSDKVDDKQTEKKRTLADLLGRIAIDGEAKSPMIRRCDGCSLFYLPGPEESHGFEAMKAHHTAEDTVKGTTTFPKREDRKVFRFQGDDSKSSECHEALQDHIRAAENHESIQQPDANTFSHMSRLAPKDLDEAASLRRVLIPRSNANNHLGSPQWQSEAEMDGADSHRTIQFRNSCSEKVAG